MVGVVGELTAPNSAPSHSFLSVSTVLSGSATPFFLNSSKPASRSIKENVSPRLFGRASRIARPAGMTSRPMPSPGIRPAVCQWLCEAEQASSIVHTDSEMSCCRHCSCVELSLSSLQHWQYFEYRPTSAKSSDAAVNACCAQFEHGEHSSCLDQIWEARQRREHRCRH